jgi:hypothetical protein
MLFALEATSSTFLVLMLFHSGWQRRLRDRAARHMW